MKRAQQMQRQPIQLPRPRLKSGYSFEKVLGERKLIQLRNKDLRADLAAAALSQEWMKESAIIIVIAAVYARATQKYGQRGIRYAHMEVGHAAQNVYLQAASLKLGTTLVGAFDDKRVKEVLKLPSDEQPLGMMPIGGR
jgi:SagB-type dehydrogenase family enzyme